MGAYKEAKKNGVATSFSQSQPDKFSISELITEADQANINFI